MPNGLVISDLHLFSRRSAGDALFASLGHHQEQKEILVLNGDIFDFRWSCLANEATTIAAALNWMEELLMNKHWEVVHYLFGNHDCLSEFQNALRTMTEGRDDFHCHEFRLQLGRNLFLHGDCTNRRMGGKALQRYRKGWKEDRPRGTFLKALYDGVDATGISRLFHHCYFPSQRSARRVAYHLDDVMPEWRDNIDDCFFGHTHRPFKNHELDGVRFHNTGSGIQGMGFHPLTFQYQPG